MKTITKKSWVEFKDAGLLWWINRILHTFGWTIVIEVENDIIVDVYPARTVFRGFSSNDEAEGYTNVTNYLKENILDIGEDLDA